MYTLSLSAIVTVYLPTIISQRFIQQPLAVWVRHLGLVPLQERKDLLVIPESDRSTKTHAHISKIAMGKTFNC